MSNVKLINNNIADTNNNINISINNKNDQSSKVNKLVNNQSTEWKAKQADSDQQIKASKTDLQIKNCHLEWFLNQAAILSELKNTDKKTREKLKMIMLQAYSKAATIRPDEAEKLNIQTTPVFPGYCIYHRSSRSKLLESVRRDYAKNLGFEMNEIQVVSSPLIKEIFNRDLPLPTGFNSSESDVNSLNQFSALVDNLLLEAGKGNYPKDLFVVDISKMLPKEKVDTKKLKKIVEKCKKILEKKVKSFKKKHPNIDINQINEQVVNNLQLVAIKKHKDQHILIAPKFRNTIPDISKKHDLFMDELNKIMIRTGYRLSPDQAKSAWLRVKSYKGILKELGIPKAKLNTKGKMIEQVCKNFSEFMQGKATEEFKALKNDASETPYLQVLPKVTINLLQGFADYRDPKGRTIDEIYQHKGLGNLLQYSYFKMRHAMEEAVKKKDDNFDFLNCIELIHQEIQTILAIVEPYTDDVLAESVVKKMREGHEPIVPSDYSSPKVHLKPSAMHCINSIVASAEAQKGTNQLNIALLNDCYFELNDSVKPDSKHTTYYLDGDKFTENLNSIDEAFDKPPEKPIDLFICEYHHNLSLSRHVYKPENICGMIKKMVKEGKVAEKFTVAIDTTINLEKSDDIRQLLADEEIKKLILEGRLNIALLRSAQKYDMLGMDNYYGGITTTINQENAFQAFNERMDHVDDQLEGLSYQGLAHIQKFAGDYIDKYREGVIANNNYLYSQLHPNLIYKEDSLNPMQISRIEDDRLVFLDIKFRKGYSKSARQIRLTLNKFLNDTKTGFTQRPSIGFANTNFLFIENKKFRMTPGLENKQQIKMFAEYFNAIQEAIESVTNNPENIQRIKNMSEYDKNEYLDEKIAEKINSIDFKILKPKNEKTKIKFNSKQCKQLYVDLSRIDDKILRNGIKSLNENEKALIIKCSLLKNQNFKNSQISLEKFNNLKNSIFSKLKTDKKTNDYSISAIFENFLQSINLHTKDDAIFNSIKGKKMESSDLKNVLQDLQKFKNKNPNTPVSFDEFIAERGFSNELVDLNFSELTTIGISKISSKPRWGTDLLKNVSFEGIHFKNCDFTAVNLKESTLSDCTFDHCNLQSSVFFKTKLKDVCFKDSLCEDASFNESQLDAVDFYRTNVSYSNFQDASLNTTSFSNCAMNGTNFIEAGIANDCHLIDCDLMDCLLFEAKSSFKIQGGKEHKITKPITGLLWNLEQPGLTATKVLSSLKQHETIPLRYHYHPENLDIGQLNQEVKKQLRNISENPDNSAISIPAQLMDNCKKDPKNNPLIANIQSKAKNFLKHIDSILLPGGLDIPPEFYGQEKTGDYSIDPDYRRSMLEFSILNEMRTMGIPCLGICRGFQITNIFNGGTLKQYVKDQSFRVQKYTALPPDEQSGTGIIRGFLKDNTLNGLSDHHQSNDILGDDLEPIFMHPIDNVNAKNSFNIPKAAENKWGAPIILTQFHPEFRGDTATLKATALHNELSPENERFFTGFIDAANVYKRKKSLHKDIQLQAVK